MPRFWAFFPAVLIVTLVILAGLEMLTVNPVRAESLSPWGSTTAYPTAIYIQSCSVSSGYIYCVGGANGSGALGPTTNAVYYAPVSSSGVGAWTATTPHPTPIAASCTVSSGYIYCVGGQTSAVYYAPISPSGVGTWTNTTAYPISIGTSCAVSTGFIYCVGGQSHTSPTNSTLSPTSAVYYAPVSSSGVGIWTTTSAYPVATRAQSCAVSSGYIFCVGGQTSSGTTGAVYYAPVSSSGVGTWTTTTAYPTAIYLPSCAVSSGYIYCVGGLTSLSTASAVYYAPVSSSGVGSWSNTASYPTATYAESCTTSSGYIYCVGGNTNSGLTNAVYYSGVLLPSATTTITSTQVSTSTTSVSTSPLTSAPTTPSGTQTSTGPSFSSSSSSAAQGGAGITEFELFALIAVILILAGGVLVIGLTTVRKRRKEPSSL